MSAQPQRVENAWKNVAFKPDRVVTPAGIDAVVALVNAARAEGRRLKAYGGRHSMNHVFRTADTLVDLRRLNRVLSVDRNAGTIEVEAGLTIGDAIEAFEDEELAFPSLGSWYTQSIAGAIATSTHGSSLVHGSLSELVSAVEVVRADGAVVRYAAEDDTLKALRAHLGLLGLVTKVELTLTPSFWLACHVESLPDTEGFERIVETARAHEYANLLWLPYLEESAIRVLDRVDATERNAASMALEARFREPSVFRHRLQDVGVFALGHVNVRRPRLLGGYYNRQVRAAFYDDDGVVDRSYRVFLYDQYREPTENHRLRMIMNVEYAVDVARLTELLHAMKRLVAEWRQRGVYLNYPRVHVRFAPGSDRTLVGLNADRDTAYVGIYIVGSIRHRTQVALAEAIEDLFLAFDGRPHWGKYRYRTTRSFEGTYPNWARFETVRQAMDPDGMFADGGAMFTDLNRFERTPWGAILRSLVDRDEYQPIRQWRSAGR